MTGRAMAATAWALAAVALTLFALASCWVPWALDTRTATGHPDILFFAASLSYAVVGATVASRRPGNAIGWLLLAEECSSRSSASRSATPTSRSMPKPRHLPGGRSWRGRETRSGSHRGRRLVPRAALSDGPLRSPRWRPVAGVGLLLAAAGFASDAFEPGSMGGSLADMDNPLGIPGGGACCRRWEPWPRRSPSHFSSGRRCSPSRCDSRSRCCAASPAPLAGVRRPRARHRLPARRDPPGPWPPQLGLCLLLPAATRRTPSSDRGRDPSTSALRHRSHHRRHRDRHHGGWFRRARLRSNRRGRRGCRGRPHRLERRSHRRRDCSRRARFPARAPVGPPARPENRVRPPAPQEQAGGLAIRCLGAFRVFRDGRPSPRLPGSRRRRARCSRSSSPDGAARLHVPC